MWNKNFSSHFINNFDHLQNRSQFSLQKCFLTTSENPSDLEQKKIDSLFLLAPSDVGVIRNGGRRGALWGPEALLNYLQKATIQNTPMILAKILVTSLENEQENFEESQRAQAQSILKAISSQELSGPGILPHFHLGGGHDHFYSLSKALLAHPQVKKILVINLDPHLDTRNDSLAHSGTPFRQLAKKAQEVQKKVDCIQWGTALFCNPKSSYEEVDNHFYNSKIWNEKKQSLISYLNLLKLEEGQYVILSLDCDIINSSLMEAVSAPAWAGVDLGEIEKIIISYLELMTRHHLRPFIGIYEYNPLFDNLSMKGAKGICSLIYKALTFNYY